MPERPDGVAAVVRHREAVLVCRGVGDRADRGRRLPTRFLGSATPEATLGDLLDELGMAAATVERRGEPVDVSDRTLIPYLVTAGAREATASDDCPAPTWAEPGTLLEPADGPWWPVYEAVAPTVDTVAADTDRGSTAIAVDALWALRDAATRAAVEQSGLAPVRSLAEALLDARPSMAALGNRVNRTMAGAEHPAEVEAAASEGIVRAHEADAAAARLAADTIGGGRVLTLSRSGTVHEALLDARPEVVVLASRPGGEGLAVASALVEAGLSVCSCADAEVYDQLRADEIDAILVGADAITPDGWVVNKVGTRAAALAGDLAGVPFYVVCASDKIRPSIDGEDAMVPPLEPLFDLTPPSLVAGFLTERGRMSPEDIQAVAREHGELAGWRDGAS